MACPPSGTCTGTESPLGAYPRDLPSGTLVDVDREHEGGRGGDVTRRDGVGGVRARWFAMPDDNAVLQVTTPVRPTPSGRWNRARPAARRC